jgi:hypothetical protein
LAVTASSPPAVRTEVGRRLRAALAGESLWLFLAAWALLGCFVHTRNQVTWNLQHAWVESLAERGTMYVDGSATERFALDRLGDYWTAPDGHAYANSAPGAYLAAAAVYSVARRALGITYRDSFDLASTLVTFLTTGLASATSFLLLYRLARRATGSRAGGLWVAGAYAFGTHAFAYAGVPYQHLSAAAPFVAAFALAFARQRDAEAHVARPALEGLLVGLGLTCSFAYLPMALAIAGYCLLLPGRRRAALFLAGALAGLLPLLVVNALHFGGPLTTVYDHSQDPNLTRYRLSWAAVAWRARFYFTDPTTGVFYYSPVLLLAVVGLWRGPSDLKRERLAIAAGALLTLGHLSVVHGTGEAQFPPRLLIPILPFLALGFVPFWRREGGPLARPWTRALFVLLLVPSVFFCALGALGPTMFRDVARWNAWYVYLHALFPPVPEGMPVYNLPAYVFPLRPVLAWVAPAAALVAAWRLRAAGAAA